jgi:CheY-like chemotaxis protein
MIADEEMPFKGKKALVAEDNDLNIMMLTYMLEGYGIDFDVVKDGQEALALFNNHHYDIILTDIHIPGITGDQLTAAIRGNKDALKAGIPIIALTASSMEEEIASYLQTGINDVLIKPFKEVELTMILTKYL